MDKFFTVSARLVLIVSITAAVILISAHLLQEQFGIATRVDEETALIVLLFIPSATLVYLFHRLLYRLFSRL